jgi:hypothetical protein
VVFVVKTEILDGKTMPSGSLIGVGIIQVHNRYFLKTNQEV